MNSHESQRSSWLCRPSLVIMRRLSAVLTATVLCATSGCSLLPSGGADGVKTVVKADGGQQTVPNSSGSFASLFIAYDSASAQRLWDDNVPAGLPHLEGDPLQQGLYGDLADVDFDDQVVGLWSAGESGSCPAWLAEVRTGTDGSLVVTEGLDTDGNETCTDDNNAYRAVVLIDRDAVPDAGALRSEGTTDPDPFPLRVFVGAYPPA